MVGWQRVMDKEVHKRLGGKLKELKMLYGLSQEKLASTEKHAICNSIAETAKLQGWQLVNGAYV
jgi:hypothetical protein